MKNNLITLLLLTSISIMGQSRIISKPPKKTWKILIKNSNTKEDNYNMIGQIIIDNDLTIERKDIDYLTLETAPTVTNGHTSIYYLKFVAKDNLIVLTGMAKSRINVGLTNVDEEYLKIQNVGMKGSINRDQWDSMFNFTKLFLNSDLEFITE